VSEVTATFPGGREGAAGRRPAARRAAPAMMSDGDRRTEDRGRAAPGGALPIDESETHEITLRYTRDEEPVRRDFGHRLALFLRRAAGRWDITPLVDTVGQLGRRIPEVTVRLRHRPTTGELRVSLEFELAPAPGTEPG